MGLDEALTSFTKAVKYVIKTQAHEEVIRHFANSPKSELKLILNACENIEEYEVCAVIAEALNHKESIAA